MRILILVYAAPTYNILDKATDDAIAYVDIKSEGLRDILRTVLRDVNGICLREDKPTVQSSLVLIKDFGIFIGR